MSADGVGELAELGDEEKSVAEARKIARGTVPGAEAAGKALDVTDEAEGLLHLGDEVLRVNESLDSILARADGKDVEERRSNPLAEETCAHGRGSFVEDAEEGTVRGTIANGVSELEVAARDFIEDHVLFAMEDAKGADMFKAGVGEVFADIAEGGTCGSDATRELFTAEAIERENAEVVQQSVTAVVEVNGIKRDEKRVVEELVG